MNHYITIIVAFLALVASLQVRCQQQQQQQMSQSDLANLQQQMPTNVPYYMQSPMAEDQPGSNNQQSAGESGQLNQRSLPGRFIRPISRPMGSRKLDGALGGVLPKPIGENTTPFTPDTPTPFPVVIGSPPPPPPSTEAPVVIGGPPEVEPEPVKPKCLYDKQYFAGFDECLAKRPYPTVGLPAFKNEDLWVSEGSRSQSGCQFSLSGGLFKNYQISKFSIDNDVQCLDGSKVGLQINFSNVTLAYLWSLRCLNQADQLLEDATLGGKTLASGDTSTRPTVCVGSSQNFGFTSLQLSNLETQVEFATDIYKNWRVTNVTVAMKNPLTLPTSSARSSSAQSSPNSEEAVVGTNIKDFVFESLDGDELNWRYLHLYQNWSRNRMHANFVDQFRRFLWISLQRCLSESSEKLPVKLFDAFTNQKLN